MLADVAPIIANDGVDRFRAFFWASAEGFESVDHAAEALTIHLDQPRLDDASGLTKAMRRGDDGRFYWHWDPRTVSPEFLNPPSESQTIEAAAARITTPVVMLRAEYSEIGRPACRGKGVAVRVVLGGRRN